MRRLKHKHTRRTIKFYKIVHGFREPFKVLIDGNFVKAVQESSLGAPRELLAKLLGASIKVYTTRCILQEIKRLGPSFTGVYRAAKEASMHLSCSHTQSCVAAAACIKDCVGVSNAEHLFVATQDRGLRSVLQSVEGGASIFVSVNGLHIEPPSEKQRHSARKGDEGRMDVAPHELAAGALKALPDLQPKDTTGRIFRRHRAKGPNPLAVKKKKKHPQTKDTAEPEIAHASRRKRARARQKADMLGMGEAAV